MNQQLLHKFVLLFAAIFIGACDFLNEEEPEQDQSIKYTNTLGQNLGGTQGAVCLLYTSPSPRDDT